MEESSSSVGSKRLKITMDVESLIQAGSVSWEDIYGYTEHFPSPVSNLRHLNVKIEPVPRSSWNWSHLMEGDYQL
jgi:hypothetical protein